MSEAKAEMYGSYLALFYIASAMIVIQFFFDSKVGPVLWGLVAWQIYRRNEFTLIITLRSLFWLIVVGEIVGIIWVVVDPLNLKLQQFMADEGLAVAISAGLFWWMRALFAKSPAAADIFSASIAGTQAPASANIATVESPALESPPEKILTRVVASPAPEPPAGNILTRVFARAKQFMPRRGRPPQPAFAGIPPAVPKQVEASPYIKAEPGDFPKTVPPESRGTIPLLTVVEEERVYAEIDNELETGGIDKGLWARLFAECDGDERRTKVLYIRQRAERLVSAERARRSKRT